MVFPKAWQDYNEKEFRGTEHPASQQGPKLGVVSNGRWEKAERVGDWGVGWGQGEPNL